jgi:hypothetical protein
MKRLITAALCLMSLGACLAAASVTKPLEATVTRVTDGDSLWLEPAGWCTGGTAPAGRRA